MNSIRRQRLIALGDLYDRWVASNLAAVSQRFDPSGRPTKTVYNQHHIDIDADGTALDEFDEQSMAILAAEVIPLQRAASVTDWNAKNPRNPKDGDGKWTEAPGGAARVSKKIGDWFRSPTYQGISTGGHIALDVVGLAPGFGEPVDLVNAAWYLAEREYKDAFLSLGSAVPGLGYATSVLKVLKHIRRVRKLIKARKAIKAAKTADKTLDAVDAAADVAKATTRSAARSPRVALGVALDGKHDTQLARQLRDRWGTDPRPWAVLHAHITERAGEQQADDATAAWFLAANGLEAVEDLRRSGVPARLRMAGKVDEHGHLHSPADGRFMSKGAAVPETPGELFRWFRETRDPLGILEVPGVNGLTGSARVGDADSFGVNLFGDHPSVVIGNGTSAAGRGLANNDEASALGPEQIPQMRKALRNAVRAAESGEPFDAVVEGEDVGDVSVSVEPGDRSIRVSAFSWTTASRETDAREELADLRQAFEKRVAGWDPVTDKEHLLGRWPTRADFADDVQVQEYLDEGGFDSWDDFEDFAEINDFEPYTFEEFLKDLGREPPQMEFPPPPAAVLSESEVGKLVDAIDRLSSDPPYYRLRQALRRGELEAMLGQRSAGSSFVRRKDWVEDDVDRDRNGRFAEEDGLDDPWDAVSIFGGRDAAGQHIVAFDDPGKAVLPDGGRGVAMRDDQNMGEIREAGDLQESTIISASDVDTVAAGLDRMAVLALDHDGAGEGLTLLGSDQVGGFHVAAIHDVDGEIGLEGDTLVAVSYNPGGDAPWGDLAGNRDAFDVILADEVDDLTAALRSAAAAQPKAKQGLDRKIDKLRLDGKIDLADGELLTASGTAKGGQYSDHDALVATTSGPDGPRLRFGVPAPDFEDRVWDAADDGDTVVLDAAGLDAIDDAMAQAKTAAVADRQRLKAIYAATEAKVEVLQDQLRVIRPEIGERELTADEQQQAAGLKAQAEEIRKTPEVAEFYNLHRRVSELDRRTLGKPTKHGYESVPRTPEDQAERDSLFARIQELSDRPDVRQAEDLYRQADRIEHRRYEKLPLTAEQEVARKRIEEQIQALYSADPMPDDKIISGVIPSQWGKLVWEVHGRDDFGDNLEDAEKAWRVEFGIAPSDAGPDWTIFDRDDDVSVDLGSDEIDKFLKDLRKIATVGGFPAPPSTRSSLGLTRKFNPAQPRDAGGEDGGQWVKGPGTAAGALDKLKLARLAPAGFRVRSSKKLKTDYADVGIAEVDGPDGPQVRIGVIGNESGKWDAGFTGEGRKAQLREEIARKQALMDSDSDDVDEDIEDQISELQSELEDLEGERTAIVSPEVMADFRRQLGEGLTVAKANKAEQDAAVKEFDALDEKRDAIIAEHSDAALEREIRDASWAVRSRRKTIKGLEDGPSNPRWSPELVAELLEMHRTELAKAEAELAPLLARRAELMPPDALARIEDLDRQYRALNDADIDDMLTAAEVSAPNGTRVRAEIWGSDDEDEQWTKTRLYVLAPGETTADVDDYGDDYGNFPGLKGLNKLIAALDESRVQETFDRSRSAGMLAVSIVDTLIGDAYTPEQRQARTEWLARAAGADTHAGDGELKAYWTKSPEGLAKWATLPEGRWTALFNQLKKHMSADKARRVASAWFAEVIGYSSGSDKNLVASGRPPRGKVVGPG